MLGISVKGRMMWHDVLTAVWKERESLFRHRSRGLWAITFLLGPCFLAIIAAWVAGPEWVTDSSSQLGTVLVSVIMVAVAIPGLLAGERERCTLGTLLTSRLPDQAILFGRLAFAVAFAFSGVLAFLFVGLVTVNVLHGSGGLLLYALKVFLADVALGFLMAVLSSGVGLLISLRVATVQDASILLVASFLLPPMFFGLVLLMLPAFLGDQFRDWVPRLAGTQVLLIILAGLAVLDLGVLAALRARSRRTRLCMD
jgi:ABC-2 type transport system permease protein